LLTSRRALERGFFDAQRLDLYLRRHESGRADLSRGIWAPACLEMWRRTFLDPADVPSGPVAP
jgi:hypothetical protein